MLTHRIIAAYTTVKLRESFWQLAPDARRRVLANFLAAAAGTGQHVEFYQVFPARAEFDLLLWSTSDCTTLESPDAFFAAGARCLNPFRGHLDIPLTLCGVTKPSVYVRQHENPQEINPYDADRKPYFVIYPFSKTADWYLKPKEERQELMTGHIRLGKQYPTIKQLLLYSFGIQDQEFVVAYEMDDLPLFSDLVQALRATEARRYTLLDTPIITGVRRSASDLTALFSSETPSA